MSETEGTADGGPRKTKAWSGELSPRAEGTLPDGVVEDVDPPESDDLSGRTLADRYLVIKKIGQGGMGEVYLGEHTTINKKVAIKVLSERYKGRRDVISRFLQEARAASSIRHENVVDITDFGETPEGLVFFVMEYLEGMELSAVMEAAGAMPWGRARAVMLQILDALGTAHDGGVIHRDMKPDNCFVVRRAGNRDFVKVLDFGIAKITTDDDAQSLTRTGVIMGTANYMSPEQAHGDRLDPRTDLYSCGVILYEMVTGRLPFTGNNPMSVMYKHLHTDPIPPRSIAPECNIPEAVEDVVLKALQKKPDLRFQSADEFATALRALGDEAADGADPDARRGGKTGLVLSAVAAIVLLGGLGAFAMMGGDDEGRDAAGAAAAVAKGPAAAAVTPLVEAAPPPAPPTDAAIEPQPPQPDGAEPSEDDAASDAEDEDAPEGEADREPSADAKAGTSTAPTKKATKASRKPAAKRSDKEIRKAIAKQVESKAKACLQREGAFPGERLQVKFTIATDGSVNVAKAGRKHAGTPMGKCVEQAVKKARFGPAAEAQSSEYSFKL